MAPCRRLPSLRSSASPSRPPSGECYSSGRRQKADSQLNIPLLPEGEAGFREMWVDPARSAGDDERTSPPPNASRLRWLAGRGGLTEKLPGWWELLSTFAFRLSPSK